jgi:hypothetical protein
MKKFYGELVFTLFIHSDLVVSLVPQKKNSAANEPSTSSIGLDAYRM